MPAVCEWPDVVVLEHDEVKTGDSLLAARRNLLAAHSANVARSRGSVFGYDTYGNLRGAEVEALLRELRRLYVGSSGIRVPDVGGAARLVVYRSLPVRVHDGVGWIDDVVDGVYTGSDGCSDGSPYFYVRGSAGHWHLSGCGRTWEVHRGVEGSLEQVLVKLLEEGGRGNLDPDELVKSVVEACVARFDCGVSFCREEVSSAK